MNETIMKYLNLVIVFFSLLLFSRCTNENKALPDNPVNEDLQILNFQFLADNNSSISNDIIGEINEDENKIYLSLPFNTSVTSLTPTITITNGATITPSNNITQDFSEPIDYVLSKDRFNNVTYSVIVTLEEEQEESDASILNFSFLIENNNFQLSDNYEGIIEGEEIKVFISGYESLTSVIPTIEISEGASISPTIDTGIDFRNDVVFTVTSENGETQKKYTVKIVRLMIVKEDIKFEVAIDDKTFKATIDNDLNEIRLKVPEGTDVTNLTPEIQVSNEAEISPLSGTPQDFSIPVTYTITAKDGLEKEYTVYVSFLSPLGLDRLFLEEFYRVNKAYNSLTMYHLFLDWDIEASTMENWTGVTIVDGRVSELVVAYVNINEIPSSINYLDKLKLLIIQSANLTSLPPEIGSLENLEVLSLKQNNLSVLPKEIGNLNALIGINLKDNSLQELPKEIGNLSNLYRLDVCENSLLELPTEISNLSNLSVLNLKNNPITVIPEVICNMRSNNNVYIDDYDDKCM
ncbi:DUF5018 domain-containing protein [Tenacibaculum sp. M341]|uniref:DUF5018 domain-containing protein n=1 Tax=Tenacibaculum sp. M341 TaxID=2530339 RepID=UPI001404AEE5|nr:DUF5018 domain-containing protein [Tenacibaculum sp. M341]